MFSISSFSSVVSRNDVQRPNLFHVKVSIPPGLKGDLDEDVSGAINRSTDQGRGFSAFCRTATLPGAAFGLAEARRYGIGPTVRTPVFSSSSPDVSLTFMSDSKNALRFHFINWMKCIYRWDPTKDVGANKNYLLGYKNDYSTTLEIETFHGEPGKYRGSGILQAITTAAFSAAGTPFLSSSFLNRVPGFPLKKTATYKLYKAFPTSVSETSLSHDATNTITEFTVNFSYFDWIMEPT
jgi:hypothetical protein